MCCYVEAHLMKPKCVRYKMLRVSVHYLDLVTIVGIFLFIPASLNFDASRKTHLGLDFRPRPPLSSLTNPIFIEWTKKVMVVNFLSFCFRHIHMDALAHTHTHSCTLTNAHSHTRTHTHAQTHEHNSIYTHIHLHTQINAWTNTHRHTLFPLQLFHFRFKFTISLPHSFF